MDLYATSSTISGVGLGIFNDSNNFNSLYTNYRNYIYETSRLNGNEIDESKGSINITNKWLHYEFIVDSDNNEFSINIFSIDNETLIFSKTIDLRITISSETFIGICQTWETNNSFKVKNITAVEL